MTRYVILPATHPDDEWRPRAQYTSGDTVVMQNGAIWFSKGVAIQGKPAGSQGTLSDLTLTINGSLAGNRAAIDLYSEVSAVRDADVLIGPSGVVTGVRHALVLRSGSGNEIVNRGAMAGIDGAIRVGGEIEITNHGYMGTVGARYFDAPRYHAISITNGTARILNTGLIEGVDEGLAADRQAAVVTDAGARLDLVSAQGATISAGTRGTAILGGNRDDAVANAGRITGGLDLRAGDDAVTNSGTITGSLMMGRGNDTVRHTGVVQGRISLGDGHDLFEAGPTSAAPLVVGGRGNDTYVLAAGSQVRILEDAGWGTDTIRSHGDIAPVGYVERLILIGSADASAAGSGGDNTILGNTGDNLLDGLAGDDEIIGGGGDDRVQGGEGADRLSGWDGDDRLKGEGGADSLHGGNGADEVLGGLGDDELSGGIGDDRLKGRDGADRLVGGEGSDLLVGGLGADELWSGWGDDVLEWRRADDAGTEPGSRDVVHDLNPERDLLRFTFELAYQAGRFSGERAEVRLVEKGTDTFVRVDADGDGQEDMTIVLRGVTGLGEDALAL